MPRIHKLLIANRGEIARRIIRTCRAMGIATVAVHSDPDADAPFVAEADEAVALGGATSAESYLRADAIVAAAQATGADAVHPGYGFLSENADFARRCAAAGLVFVGPPPEAIEAMGSKLAAKALMESAGVPVLRGEDVSALDGDELERAAERVGLPVLVKASFGGGGKGMRVVRTMAELRAAVDAARREAGAALGDDTVFLERYVDSSRHVEIQLFGDQHGTVTHLFERECSIQRRHQKILEEAPSPAVDTELRAEMGAAAVTAGKAIGYVGAGTVEFLLAPGGEFFFLEVNTRLQVEHPVTEAVTGLDLVRVQLLVAQGEPLPGIVLEASISGHAIEARVYAEDPERDFLPAAGRLRRFEIPSGDGIRVDSGITGATTVSVHYDPMLAKVVAHAPTRLETAARLADTLARARIHGIVTNRDALVNILRHEAFLAGDTDTHFLERHSADRLGAPRAGPEAERLHALAAALALQAARRAASGTCPAVPSGWRNNPSQLQEVSFEGRGGRIDIGYRLGRDAHFSVDGQPSDITVLRATADEVQLVVSGVRRRFDVARSPGGIVDVDSALGHSMLRELERFPRPGTHAAVGSLVAPMPGTVVQLPVAVGDTVHEGQVMAVIEAMKMQHDVTTPVAGRVTEIPVEVGQAVEGGTVLVVVEE